MNIRDARTTRIAVMLGAAVAMLLTACGHAGSGGPSTQAAQGRALLNTVTASQLIDDFTKAGLPVPNTRDNTAQQCPNLHCAQAIDTDTVSVLKFPGTGLAQKYEGSISNVYQVEDIVLVFAPTVSADLKQKYEAVAERAVVARVASAG